MIEDIRTVIWKEWRELLMQRGSMSRGLIRIVGLPILLLGFILPWQAGLTWLSSGMSLLFVGWLPLIFLISIIADSFAGERERHTLETLLASRLSDQAILFGKIGAAVLYSWGLAVVSFTLSIVTVNVVHSPGDLVLPSFNFMSALLLFNLLLSILVSCTGVLVSLRASTVRQAVQTLSLGMTAFFILAFSALQWLPPEMQIDFVRAFRGRRLVRTELMIALGLITLNVLVLIAARARFRRAKLILD